MNCKQAQDLFNAHLDGDLTGSLAAEFAAHKLQCASCRRELALLEVTGHVLAADTRTPSLDAEFTDRLIACATAPAPRRLLPGRRTLLAVFGPLAAAACLLLAFSLGDNEARVADQGDAPATYVLPDVERMDTPEEMLSQIQQVRRAHPEIAELEALEIALREKIEQIAGDTEESAKLLESFGEMTIMEILETLQRDRSQPQAPAAPGSDASGDRHDPSVEKL